MPKPNRAEDIRRVVAIIERLEERHHLPFGSTKLLPIATETPEGLLHIREIAGASPRIAAISWGIEDLSAAMGLPRTRDAEGRYLDIPRYARVMCAVAASAAGVEAIDTVYTDIADVEGLRRECRDGVAMSFTGKISIHPGQLEAINQEFTPSREAADEAVELIAAFEAHAARGAGAFAWKGQMMDMPHLTRAQEDRRPRPPGRRALAWDGEHVKITDVTVKRYSASRDPGPMPRVSRSSRSTRMPERPGWDS